MKKFRVLMVEDDEGDARLTQEAVEDAKLAIDLDVVEDGEQALNYLRRQPPFENSQKPDLLLLDLNLPRRSGQEVLREIRNDPALKTLPVVILTTSEAETDLRACYAEGANCYVTKPVGFLEFSKVVQSVASFWFTIVCLPPAKDA